MIAPAGRAPWGALPQTFPFLMADRVVEHRSGNSCTVRVAVTGGAFHGERPGPLPASVLVEMLCQACALLDPAGGLAAPAGADPDGEEAMPAATGARGGPTGSGRRLAALRSFRFLRPVRPGELLTLSVRRIGGFGRAARFAACARCADETIAEGELTLGG